MLYADFDEAYKTRLTDFPEKVKYATIAGVLSGPNNNYYIYEENDRFFVPNEANIDIGDITHAKHNCIVTDANTGLAYAVHFFKDPYVMKS